MFAFKGAIQLVCSEKVCDAAVRKLRRDAALGGGVVGLDTEHVAFTEGYNDGEGTNHKEAAIIQCCASENLCVIFMVSQWPPICFESLKTFLLDGSITKVPYMANFQPDPVLQTHIQPRMQVAVNASADVRAIEERFPDLCANSSLAGFLDIITEMKGKCPSLVCCVDVRCSVVILTEVMTHAFNLHTCPYPHSRGGTASQIWPRFCCISPWTSG